MGLNIEAKNVLEPAFVSSYNELISHFYHEVFRINTMEYQFKRIIEFPFRDLYLARYIDLFNMILRNYADNFVIMINRMLFDNDSRVITIPKFKNRIIKNIVGEDIREEFKAYLKENYKVEDEKDISRKLTIIRNEIIAHSNEGIIYDSSLIPRITWDDLFSINEMVNKSFLCLTFSASFLMRPAEYDNHIRELNSKTMNKDPDIDSLLTMLALSSEMVQKPIEELVFLKDQSYKEKYKDSFNNINKYRLLAKNDLIEL